MQITQMEFETALHDENTLALKENMDQAAKAGIALLIETDDGEIVSEVRSKVRRVARMLKIKGIHTHINGDGDIVVELPAKGAKG